MINMDLELNYITAMTIIDYHVSKIYTEMNFGHINENFLT